MRIKVKARRSVSCNDLLQMPDRTIPSELRNNISAVLRAAEAGETFTVTVGGRPVARVVAPGDPGQPRIDVDRETIRRILAAPIDEKLAAELDAAEAALDDPWLPA
jgi:antitoxin (DNA-binding transcriptional repressor) of toxin-antitoxin stability system